MQQKFMILLNLLLLISQYSVRSIVLNSSLLVSNGYDNSTTTYISLSSKNIDTIDPNTFKGYNELTTIYLAFNNLTHIDLQAFSAAPNLTTLTLSYNPLVQITNLNNTVNNYLTNLFMEKTSLITLDLNILKRAFPNLTYIEISSDYLNPLSPNQFVAWSKFNSFSMSVRNQQYLSTQHLAGLESVYTIRFASSNITSIQNETFANFSNLFTLDLSNNSLTNLDGLKLPSTELYLVLRKNLLTSFKPASPQSSYLKLDTLDLSQNRFLTFETIDFSSLPKLRTLYLGSNPIVNSSGIFSQLQRVNNLAWLNLDNLNIKSIPSNAFLNHSFLLSLSMAFNSIGNIESGALSNLIAVGSIDLNSNNLTKIDNTTFAGLSHLSMLTLSNNKISNIDSGSFANLPSLEKILLNGNNLTSLDGSMFSGNVYLWELNLANNRLSHIDSRTFNGLKSLSTIDLSYNQLTSLDSSVFNGCSNLKAIFLYGNSIPVDSIKNLCPSSDCIVYF